MAASLSRRAAGGALLFAPAVQEASGSDLDLPGDLALLIEAGLPERPLFDAALLAEETGSAPLDVLLCAGSIREGEILTAFASVLGIQAGRSCAELSGFASAEIRDVDAVLQAGILWSGSGPDRRLLIAMRGRAIEKLGAVIGASPPFATMVTLTPSSVFSRFVRTRCREAISDIATAGPAKSDPDLTVERLELAAGPMALGLVVLILLVLALPSITAALIEIALALIFLTHGLLRSLALFADPPASSRKRDLPDKLLPTYTVLIPLHREAAILPDIVATMRALDYPAAKLEILLLLEADDSETIMAAQALDLEPPFEVVIIPHGGAKTKPKALNVGLIGARGRLLVVFDAEDRPEPGQLRIAASRLSRAPKDLACVQAALAIDNARARPLARLFVLDYAALFDAFLPALSMLRLPILLGGSSNHFRTHILKSIGGWDPLNVTEDADLGIRLARRGYGVESIRSTTYEEAPAELWPWIKQRTRWMKGYLVTWLVHGRSLRGLADDLGWRRAIVAELLLACTPMAAIAHLGLFVIVPLQLLAGKFLTGTSWLSLLADTLTLTALAIGYCATVLLTLQGLVRRGRLGLAPWLALLPAYWCLMAVAAIRAISQLGKARSEWEKTEHGKEARAPQTAPRWAAARFGRKRRQALANALFRRTG